MYRDPLPVRCLVVLHIMLGGLEDLLPELLLLHLDMLRRRRARRRLAVDVGGLHCGVDGIHGLLRRRRRRRLLLMVEGLLRLLLHNQLLLLLRRRPGIVRLQRLKLQRENLKEP